MEEKEKKLKKRFETGELAIWIYFILLCLITLSLIVAVNNYYDKEITHSEVTSICDEYAKAQSVSYNPGTQIYEFNGLSIHKEILIASCNG